MNAEPTRAAAPAASRYRIEDLVVDARVRQVTRDGIELAVAGRSFDLLLALVRAAPDLVPFDMLMEQVWPAMVVTPETLTQRVKLLRQALGDSADNPRYILAVRGHGYRMLRAAAPVEATRPPSHSPAMSADSNRPGGHLGSVPASPIEPPTRRWLFPVVALVLVIAAGAAGWGFRYAHEVQPQQPSAAATTPYPGSSIAVLPFTNLTGEPAKDYFADGMAEELIDALGQVPGLKVPPRAATFADRGGHPDIQRIARNLAVSTVLEGDVRSAGERIRVSARLLDARSGLPIWSQSYDRPFSDLFKLQDDLAAEIIAALRAYLGTALPAPAARDPPTRDVEAYRLYLQARAVARGSPETEMRALALINEALARDPNFALALAYRAFVPANTPALGYGVPEAAFAMAQRDATRALALSPGLADALADLGSIHVVRGEWIEAEKSYRAALASDPGDFAIRNQYTLVVLRPAGRLQQAYSQLEESYRLAPAEGYTVHELALIDSLLGRDADALRYLKLHDDLGGGGQTIGNVLVYTRAAARGGHYQDAIDHSAGALPDAVSRYEGVPLMKILYSALADPAQNAAARHAFQSVVPRLESKAIDGQVRGFFVQALTMLGALDAAYDLASRSVDEGVRAGMVGSRIYLADLWLPEMRPFRLDPRFQGLVERLRLIDYWRQYGPPDGCALSGTRLRCH